MSHNTVRSLKPTKKLSPGLLDFRWANSVSQISQEWEECFGSEDVLRSFALQLAVEGSRLEDVELHYLVGRDEKGTACIIPCFSYHVVLVTIANPSIQKAVAAIRKVFPSFLRVRVFVVGSAISTCSDLVGIKDAWDETRWTHDKFMAIFDAIKKKAQELHIGLIIIKELEKELTDLLEKHWGAQAFFAAGLPATFLSVQTRERGGYFESIRSKYRNKLKKRRAIGAENGLMWEVAASSQGHDAEIYGLYQQVVENSEFVFEKVNQAFFTQIDKALGNNVFYIFGFRMVEGVKRMVSCELVLSDRNTMHAFYSGFDYWIKKNSDLYFNAFYNIIDEAERRGFTRLHTGQTAYEVKAELGAQAYDLYIGVHHRNPIIHFILSKLRKIFFPKFAFPSRDVFSTPPPPPKTKGRKIDLPKV